MCNPTVYKRIKSCKNMRIRTSLEDVCSRSKDRRNPFCQIYKKYDESIFQFLFLSLIRRLCHEQDCSSKFGRDLFLLTFLRSKVKISNKEAYMLDVGLLTIFKHAIISHPMCNVWPFVPFQKLQEQQFKHPHGLKVQAWMKSAKNLNTKIRTPDLIGVINKKP